MSSFKQTPLVSVVIPTYNRSEKIKLAIMSIINQSFQNFEIIIMDDGSTDSTRQIVEQIQQQQRVSKLRYFFHPNKGLSATRKASLEHVKGKYVCFLDDDDEYLPQRFENQLAIMENNPDIGLCYGKVLITDNEGKLIKTYPESFVSNFEQLLKGCIIQVTTVMVRKECFDQLGSFRADLKGHDDYEMWLRIALNYRIAYVNQNLAKYVQHETNMSFDKMARYKDLITIFSSFKKCRLNDIQSVALKKSIASYAYRYAMEAVNHQKFLIASGQFLISVLNRPTIGLEITWSKYPNIIYRFLKPYAAMLYYFLLSFKRVKNHD